MKKLIGAAAMSLVLASCDGESGQREHEMQDNAVETPVTSPQNSTTGAKDTSASFATSDSSTVIGYDTGARRKN